MFGSMENEGMQVLTEIATRLAYASMLGKQYGGTRDIYRALGYPSEGELSYEDYYLRWKRQDIAKAIINRPVEQTWKGDIVISNPTQEARDDDDTLYSVWKDLSERLNLKNKFIRADKLSLIGRFAILLLGFSDVKNVTSLRNPINKKAGLELLYVTPYAENKVEIYSLEENPSNPRYGLPLLYKIEVTNELTQDTKDVYVHYERVIHITGEQLDSEIYGVPYLEVVFNRLMDLDKLTGGSAEMYWRGARPGYSGKVDKDYETTPDVKEKLQKQIEEYENNLRRFLINEGLDIQSLSTQIAEPSNHVGVQIQMISAITGIPKRILTGSERGELSSIQDKDSWYELIQTRREEYSEIQILKPFVKKMMELGILPETKDYLITWTPLYFTNEKERTEIGRLRATSLASYIKDVNSPKVLPLEAFYRYILGLSDSEISEIKALREDLETNIDLEIKDSDISNKKKDENHTKSSNKNADKNENE